nr:delphilin-like [Solanum lycopersicum]
MTNPLVAYSDDESSSDSAYSQGEENQVVDGVPNLGEESQIPPQKAPSPPPKAPSPPQKTPSPPPKAPSPPSQVQGASSPVVTDSPPPPIIESPPLPVQETLTSPVHETPLSPNPTSPTATVPTIPPSSPSHHTTSQNPPLSPIHDDILLSSPHPTKPRRPRKHIAVKQVRPHSPVTRSAHAVKPADDAPSGVKRRRLGKSPIPSSVSPMDLASDTDAMSEGKQSATPPSKSKSAKRNADKFLKVGRKKYFQTKSVFRGRTFHPDILSMDLVKQVCELLRFQGWEELFLEPSLIYEKEVVEFYTNLVILEGDVASSSVKGVDIVFDATKLEEILHIPSVGIDEYNWGFDEYSSLPAQFSQGRVHSRAQTVLKGIMRSLHKLLFEIVHKVILPRGHQRHIASIRDMGLMNALECKERIDWPTLIIKHLARIVDPKLGSHQLAFGNLLTRVFDAFEVPLEEDRILTRADMFTQTILADCGISMESEQVATASPRTSGPVAQLLRELKVAEEKNASLESDNQKLRAELDSSNAEIHKLKDQLVQQQLANNARVDRVLDMLASASTKPDQPPQ